MNSRTHEFNPELDLLLERTVDVPREKVWRAWTDTEQMVKWFCPRPWKTVYAKMELYPGGAFDTTMESPEGQQFPGFGCILEVVENERLTWTSTNFPSRSSSSFTSRRGGYVPTSSTS